MKKIFVLSLAAVAALVACQKNSAPVVDEGVPMSITISLGDQTKTAVKPNGKALKSYWEAKETISIVTLDGEKEDATVICIDNFTYKGESGVAEAVFTGKFHGGDDPKFIKVIYPAIDEKTGDMASYTDFKGNPASILFKLDVKYFLGSEILPLVQVNDDNCDHFYNYCVAIGEAEVKSTHDGVLKMKKPLENLASVLKMEVRFPKDFAGAAVNHITLTCSDAKGNPRNVFANGHTPQRANFSYIDGSQLVAGQTTNEWTLYTKEITVPKDGNVTLYMPVYGVDAVVEGDTWTFTAEVGEKKLDHKCSVKSDWKFGRGYMSRVTVAFD